jgi:uridine kinase
MDLAQQLAAAVVDLAADRDRVLVGIDGPDAAGKTTLADRLADALPGPVLRVSADHHLRPRDERFRRGELSPEGYYRDSVDVAAFTRACRSPAGTTVVADGLFLLRPELRTLWALTVYLRVSEEESLRRALVRDVGCSAPSTRSSVVIGPATSRGRRSTGERRIRSARRTC